MDEIKNDEQKAIKEFKERCQKEMKELDEKISMKENKDQDQRIQRLEQFNNDLEKNLRFQMLTDIRFIEDQDLELNLPLKKRNCFHVKDVQKAKELGGITSIKDLETVIDNDEFQDLNEVKNTLNCLEDVIEEWKNDKLTIVELDEEFKVIDDPNQWKTRDHSVLTKLIYENYSSDQFKDFELFKRIDLDFFNVGKLNKGQTIDDIYMKIIDSLIMEWKTQNSFDDEIKEFIKMVPNIIEDKKEADWKLLPKWSQRIDKLKAKLSFK